MIRAAESGVVDCPISANAKSNALLGADKRPGPVPVRVDSSGVGAAVGDPQPGVVEQEVNALAVVAHQTQRPAYAGVELQP